MDFYVKLAALSGASAVILGAIGAHAFKPLNPVYKDVFHTAQTYQIIHSLAMLSAPHWKNPNLTGPLFSVGILLFSGSCYLVALNENRALGKLAPIGGLCLIAAWLTLAL
eukprot:TRINITY_DN3071_c0_g1_i1.p1 TRINITY_DN3071_c0_g1~~TRINITY_DN3071_c0_g1_i1.p1  ORF type:complete len:110 (-),score=20.11 TRINITY_DN3071_c0_g1_i1:67-396(-)